MSTSFWCIVYPKGLMMESEKKSKIGSPSQLRASAHPRGLTLLFVQPGAALLREAKGLKST
jgi:hypothetical protein